MRWFIVVGLLIGFVNTSHGQKGTSRDSLKTFSVGVTPQYLITRALRIDVEKEVFQKRNLLAASLYFHRANIEDFFEQGYTYEDRIRGLGLEVLYKYRINKERRHGGFWIGYGLGLHRITIDFQTTSWNSIILNNLEYFRLMTTDEQDRIYRLHTFALIGYKSLLGMGLYADFFVGPSYVHSIVKHSGEQPMNYDNIDEFNLNYDYSGFPYRIGATFGILIK